MLPSTFVFFFMVVFSFGYQLFMHDNDDSLLRVPHRICIKERENKAVVSCRFYVSHPKLPKDLNEIWYLRRLN